MNIKKKLQILIKLKFIHLLHMSNCLCQSLHNYELRIVTFPWQSARSGTQESKLSSCMSKSLENLSVAFKIKHIYKILTNLGAKNLLLTDLNN